MIGVPGSYFRAMAVQDYSNYRTALAREFLQNSSDARSSKINFDLNSSTRMLTVTDDGLGMDRDTIFNKLLVLGGSHKLSGSVGGFGKAKELLFFSWDKYTIRTRDLLVEGSGAHFTILEDQDYVAGTTATIWFPENEDLFWLEYNIKAQLSTNQTNCKVFFNGEEVQPLRKGRLAKELEYTSRVNGVETTQPFAHIYLNKSQEDARVYVRLRGITMFTKELWATRKGQIIIEMQGESVDLFTSNRDGLKYEAQRKLDEVITELHSNCNSALRPKAIKVERYQGSGLIEVQSPEIKKQLNIVNKLVQQTTAHVNTASTPDELLEITQTSNRIKYFLQNQQQKIQQIAANKSVEEAKQEVVKALKAFNYQPDFIVKHTDKLAKNLDPATWSKSNLKLAIIWETVLKQILFNSGKELKFAIGWTVDNHEVFSEIYKLEDGTLSFLINPTSEHLSTRNFNFLVQEVTDMAFREVARMDHKSYNESFFETYQTLRRQSRLTDFGGIIKEALKAL